MTQRGRSAARVQKVQRVQRVVVSPPLAAMNMKSALRDCLPVLIVILSRRRRISVRIANERNVDKYQSAGRLPPSSHPPRIFRCSSGLRPAPFRSGKHKEGAPLHSRCPLRGHRVYEVKNDNVAPLLLYTGPTLPDLAILCRIATWGRSLTLRASLSVPSSFYCYWK